MKTREENNEYGFFYRCAHFFDKGFWVIPAVSLLTSLWFPLIVKVVGQRFGIVDDSQNFTLFGIIITILIMAAPVILTIIKAFTEKHYDDRKILRDELANEKRHNDLFSIMINSFDDLCENKEQKIICTIQNPSPVTNGYNPHEQVENIIKEIDNNVSYMLSDNSNRIKSNDLYVGLYYSFDESGIWNCANTRQQGMSMDDLLNHNTTFKHLLNEKTSNYVFYNSKEIAKSEHHYVADGLDRYENDELIGSIAGYRFSIVSNEKKFVDMILFITTYGKKFVDVDDNETDSQHVKNVKANIEKLILEKYARRIKIELGSLYLSKHP